MNGRMILRIVLAVLMIGVIVVILRSALAPAERVEAAPPPKVITAVAAIDMPHGLLIRPQDVVWTEIPAETRRKGHIVQGEAEADDLAGAVVRQPIAAGEPISTTAVVLPGSPGFLSAALKPDMRAVSVPIDEVTGNAGLILPGDHVDLILTQTVGRDATAEKRIVSETVLSNVRVIAVGRALKVDRAEAEGGDVKAPPTARTTTLEVRPTEAEVVAVASRLGSLSLALRSLATLHRPDGDAIEAAHVPVPVWAEDVSTARRLAAAAPVEVEVPQDLPPALPSVVRVIRGSDGPEDVEGNEAPTLSRRTAEAYDPLTTARRDGLR